MSNEEKEKNAEAEEQEVLEQAQDAPAEEKGAEASLEEELLKWRDTAMRTAAEYDNYRKRMVKEKEECAKFANQRLLEELLPVIDNFEMGMAAASADTASMPISKLSITGSSSSSRRWLANLAHSSFSFTMRLR